MLKTAGRLGCCLSIAIGIGLGTAGTALGQSAEGLVRRYELIELKAEGDGASRAYGLNNTGQIVGWVEIDGARHPAHWHNRVTTDLHGTVHFELLHPYAYFSQGYGEAYHISDADQIVGTARTIIRCVDEILITNAFILRPAALTDLASPYPGDALTNLGTLGWPCGAWDSAAVGISNRNHVVGWADTDGMVVRAFLVTPAGGEFYRDDPNDGVNDLMIDLGTLTASDPVSSATAVNDAGQVTGYSYTIGDDGQAAYHAFLLTPLDNDGDGIGDTWFVGGADRVNSLMTDIGTLNGRNSWGRDINNRGQIVGESDVDIDGTAHYTHAFLWSDGTMIDLGTLQSDPRAGFSAATAINDDGVVVGWAENDQRERRAFIYQDGQMQDLNDLLYLLNEDGSTITPRIVLTEARDINRDGVIVGWGTVRGSQTGQTRGFLLNPILVDPSVFEPQAEEDGAGDQGQDGTAGSAYSDETDFGPPEELVGEDDQGAETDGAPQTGPAALCGAGATTLLPLMLLGLHGLRQRSRTRPTGSAP